LEENKAEICELLKEEIASRYYFQKGRIGSSLKNDTHVKKAISVLVDTDLYTSILKGTIKSNVASKQSYHRYEDN